MKNFRQNVCMILAMILVFTFAGCKGVGAGGNETAAATTESVIETTAPGIATGAAEETTEATLVTTVPVVETTSPSEEVTEPSVEVTEPSVEATAVPEPTEATKPTKPKPTEPKETEPKETEPAHKHEYAKKLTAPKCEAEGYTTYTCKCGDSYTADKVAASGHNFGSWVTTKEPTETKTGTAERKCAACGKVETKTLGTVNPSHSHSYTSEVTKVATCTSEGVKTFTCSCGDSYTEAIKKATHSYETKTVVATCEKDGYTVHTCSVCGDSYEDGKVPTLGHDWAHKHTEEVGHNEGVLQCVCGWTITTSKSKHGGKLHLDWNDHLDNYSLSEQVESHIGFSDWGKWVVDEPETDTWTCKTCGKTTTEEP